MFSLAATAFALLTGTAPTGARPAWEGVPADVAARFEAALRGGLAIDPARRPATPGELVERLRAGWDDQTPTGVGTVLLTDVVESTKLWEQSPQRVPALLAELQLTVDRSVEAHGGRRHGATVEGDATMSVFPNALDAVHAAIGLQRTLTGRSGALRVRAGLATGELVPVDSDVLGPTVNRAARVRDLARAGEILLSASTADVARLALPAGVELIALGPHVLRGLDGTDEIAALVTDGVSAPPDPARSPYPGLASFGSDDADLFFGREEVVARCLELFADRALRRRGRGVGQRQVVAGPRRDRSTAARRRDRATRGAPRAVTRAGGHPRPRLGGPHRRPTRGAGHPLRRPGGADRLRGRHDRPPRRAGRRRPGRRVRRVRRSSPSSPAGSPPVKCSSARSLRLTCCAPCRNRPDGAGSSSKKASPS